MHAQAVRSQRIALGLILMSMLSTSILVLHIRTTTKDTLGAVVVAIPPLLTIAVCAKSLFHYFRHRAAPSGSDITQLFAEEGAPACFPVLALVTCVLQGFCGLLMLPGAAEHGFRLPTDTAEIALAGIVGLEVVVNFAVFNTTLQAGLDTGEESCTEGTHRMYCGQCKCPQHNAQDQKPGTTHNLLRIHPSILLLVSALLGALLAYTASESNIRTTRPSLQAAFQFVPMSAALLVLHRVYFALCLWTSSWTISTRSQTMFPTACEGEAYAIGLGLSMELYVGAAVGAVTERSAFWNAGPVECAAGACLVALSLVDGALCTQALQVWRAKDTARCSGDGHKWRCTRTGCAEGPVGEVQASDGEETEQIALDSLFRAGWAGLDGLRAMVDGFRPTRPLYV
jgi:hypothetical protein